MEQNTKQINILGAEQLMMESADKLVVFLCFEQNRCLFCGYNQHDETDFFYEEKVFSKEKSLSENFKEFYFKNDYFTYPFKQVTIVHVSRNYTLIPSEAYDASMIKNLLGFAFSDATGKALNDSLPDQHAELIYSMPGELYEFCSRSFLNPIFKHSMSAVIISLLKQSRSVVAKQLSVFVRHAEVDVVCTHRGELLYANSFACSDTNDILYYILAVWKQLELDQLVDQLHISGHGERIEALRTSLQKYIQHIELLLPSVDGMSMLPVSHQLPFYLTSMLK